MASFSRQRLGSVGVSSASVNRVSDDPLGGRIGQEEEVRTWDRTTSRNEPPRSRDPIDARDLDPGPAVVAVGRGHVPAV